VQGSRKKPYHVRIGLRGFGKAEWLAIADAMAGDAWYAAKLLSGEMPTDIEELFARVDLSLFPRSARELDMDCSCPDWEVPCKHIAAVFYLLAEAFDDDPFLILGWRGRERQELLALVSSRRSGVSSGLDGAPGAPPLSACLDHYFAAGELTPPQAGGYGGSALDQLPVLPVTVRGVPLVDVLRPAYPSVSALV